MKVWSSSSLSKISFELKDSALFVPTWRIEWQGFLPCIGAMLWCISSAMAPGKLRILTRPSSQTSVPHGYHI